MKLFNNRFISLVALVMTMVPFLSSCEKEDEVKPAKAVMVSVSYMNFEAENPGEQMVTVYADGRWTVEYPEWLTVTPSEGVSTTDVTISATPNMEGGAMDKPRDVELVFKGEKIRSQYKVHVKQIGDKFRGLENTKIGDVAKVADKSTVKVGNALVVAKSSKGLILSDGTSYIYAASAEGKVGDKYDIGGTKVTKGGIAQIEPVEMAKRLSSGNAVSQPKAEDITAKFDSYNSDKVAYVTVEGIYDGAKISIPGNKLALTLVDPLSEFDIQKLSAHKILFGGYFVGKDENSIRLVVNSVKDNGEVMTVWFKDDFSWLKRFEDAWNEANPTKKAGDSVGKKKSDQAPNIANRADKTFGPMDFWGEFTEKGYSDFVGTKNSIYLQSLYLKFSRTNVHNGLKLIKPLPSNYNGKDVVLQFDWCAHCDNNKPADDIQLVIEIDGEGVVKENGAKISEPIFHKQSKEKMEYFWQKASVTLSGLNTSSKIYIRPLKYLNGENVMPHRQRWYIDNITIVTYN